MNISNCCSKYTVKIKGVVKEWNALSVIQLKNIFPL